MKRIGLILTVILGLCNMQLSAQSFFETVRKNLSGGFKLDANISNFILTDLPDTKSKLNVGGSLGGFIKYSFSEHFKIHEDILLEFRTSTFEQEGVETDFQYLGMEIPIYFMGEWKINNGNSFYAGVGPYAGMGLSAKTKSNGTETDLYEKNDETGKADMTRVDVGGAAIVGYEFNNGIQINASFRMGFTNALDENKDQSAVRGSVLSLGIAYHFGG
jgi:hypothetical protein